MLRPAQRAILPVFTAAAIAIESHDDPAYVLDQDPDLVAVVSEQGREFHAHWANRHDGPLFEACRARDAARRDPHLQREELPLPDGAAGQRDHLKR